MPSRKPSPIAVVVFSWGKFDNAELFLSVEDATRFAAENGNLAMRSVYTSNGKKPHADAAGLLMREAEDTTQFLVAAKYVQRLRKATWSKSWVIR
jgi:hypothetical protein